MAQTNSNGQENNQIRVKTIIGIVCVLLLVGIIGLWLFLPRLANHYQFALPIGDPEGLPFRVPSNMGSYMNPAVCAGDIWCHDYKLECYTQETLTQQGQWPLKQVGELQTLFGSSRPILMPASYTHTTVLYVPYGDKGCYLAYGQEGGA